jgi:hypothetical protein
MSSHGWMRDFSTEYRFRLLTYSNKTIFNTTRGSASQISANRYPSMFTQKMENGDFSVNAVYFLAGFCPF